MKLTRAGAGSGRAALILRQWIEQSKGHVVIAGIVLDIAAIDSVAVALWAWMLPGLINTVVNILDDTNKNMAG